MKRSPIVAALLLLSLAWAGAAFALSSSSIPTKVSIPWANSAGNSYIRSIPNTSQIGIQNCAASFPDGFPPLTFVPPSAGGCPPFGQDFNGILKQVTQWNEWQAAGAGSPYDATFQSAIGGYPKGAIVPSATTFGVIWISTVDNNVTNPDAGGAGWTILVGLSQNTVVTGSSAAFTPAQCGSVVERSNAGSPMSDTLPGTSPGVLPAGCSLTIVNNDTAALQAIKAGTGAAIKTIASNGWDYVGPGQSITFESDGANYWAIKQSTRTKLGANTTLFVSVSAGSNNNNGLASGAGNAFADMNFPYTFASQFLDLNGFTLTISVAAGTYGQTTFSGLILGATSPASVVVVGDTTTPANVIVTSTSNLGSIYAADGAKLIVKGFQITNTSGAGNGLLASFGSHIQTQQMNFGSVPNYNQIAATQSSIIDITGSYNITGDAGCHWIATSGSTLQTLGGTMTITAVGTHGFTSGFACTQYYAQDVINSSPVPTFSGTFTGPRFACALGGIINTGGQGVNYFPGSSSGSCPSPGAYN